MTPRSTARERPATMPGMSVARGARIVLLFVAACAAAPPPAGDPCAELFAAMPHEWPERLPVAYSLGAPATPRLLALLRERPDAPGAPAAVCVLGRLGGDGVVSALQSLLIDRSPLAVDAALALGQLRATTAVGALQACVDDPVADATTRTAAACALVRCGAGAAATPLLRAVLLAGTPAGATSGRELGLPQRPRWALERYLVQRMLAQEGASELALALDPDASWPDLVAVTERIVAWLAAR